MPSLEATYNASTGVDAFIQIERIWSLALVGEIPFEEIISVITFVRVIRMIMCERFAFVNVLKRGVTAN